MTSEQYNEFIKLITGIVVSNFLLLFVLTLIGGLIFGYIYNQKLDKDLDKKENEKRILKNRISDLESKISKLDYWITNIINKDNKNV